METRLKYFINVTCFISRFEAVIRSRFLVHFNLNAFVLLENNGNKKPSAHNLQCVCVCLYVCIYTHA